MAIVNYVRESKAFIAYASDNKITANEFVLWYALFSIFNQQATSNIWPDRFIPVSNSRLLSFTMFGAGKNGEEKLRKTRNRLIQRGLIAYKAGERNKRNPMYRMIYFSPLQEADFTHEKAGNMHGNTQGNMTGNTQDIINKPIRKPVTHTSDKKIYFNSAWRTDARSRRAVAQNILEAVGCRGISDHANATVCYYLEKGMTPEQVLDGLDGFSERSGNLENLGGWLQTAAENLGIPDGDQDYLFT